VPARWNIFQRSLKRQTEIEADPAAGIFNRGIIPREALKQHIRERGIETR
jgi:imidazole glycerol phosphate synthase subunit HisF